MNPLLGALIVLATLLLGALTDDAREPRHAAEWEWTCTLTIEEALAMTERLPAECIAPPELVADVLRDMGY